ncbi:hypothetical protein Gogos_014780 [Gossypium gossypioides]|uniref:Uncharacterized protein n=1 Tax=Gossypium gossypioides TaxID=34282 RepID=A0A7J9C021_GOSGO|nr:hypothetical protein [Gossypium gossypioides]
MKRRNRLKLHGLRDKSSSPVIVGIRDKVVKASIEMTKELFDQIEPIETRRMARKEKLMDFVLDSLDSTKEKLTGRDDALKAMVTALKEEIAKFKGDELMLQISNFNEKEAFYWFEDRLKPWEKHELGRQGITKLTIAITEAESFVELGPRKDKFETSNPKETGNGEGDHEEERDKNDNGDNGKNGGNRKWKPKNKPKNPMKYFLCNGPHMVRYYSKRSVFSAIEGENDPDKEIMRLGSIMSGVEVKKVKESGKKQVDYFFCNGPHRMRDCSDQSKLSTISKGEKVELDENLFISEKAAGKLSLSIIKSTKKIKTINFEEVPTVGVARGVELQIDEWKGKEDFEPTCTDQADSGRGNSKWGQIRATTYCERDVPTSETVRARR